MCRACADERDIAKRLGAGLLDLPSDWYDHTTARKSRRRVRRWKAAKCEPSYDARDLVRAEQNTASLLSSPMGLEIDMTLERLGPQQPSYELLERNQNGYKYRLTERYEHKFLARTILPAVALACSYHTLYPQQVIAFEVGYAWDGCSGPAIDRPVTMLASLVHDGLYQLMRERLLAQRYREWADLEFYRLLDRSGFTFARAYYKGVRLFAGYAARPK